MMDREWRDEWVRALRSGEFQQGCGKLKRDHAHCCLGVLCELRPDVRWEGVGQRFAVTDDDSSDERLPDDLLDDLVLDWNHANHLINLNDGRNGYRKHTFREIADWIEANL